MSRAGKIGGKTTPRVGDYAIERLIGKGGMAEVYLGRGLAGELEGREVAIKRLLPEAARDSDIVDRFLGEADLARMIDHSGVVEVYDFGTVGQSHYIVMEYVDGRDLRFLLDMCKKRAMALPVTWCTHIVARVLEAAAALHEAVSLDGTPLEVVHCDLTPANVFLSRDGEIKLGDLGVARVGAIGESDATMAAGKLRYLSPEQIDGVHVDRRTDLFSAGVILFELLTQRVPFEAEGIGDLRVAFRRGAPEPCRLRSDVSEGLAEVVLRSLEIDPAKRFFDARAFLEALRPHRETGVAGDLAMASMVRLLFPES